MSRPEIFKTLAPLMLLGSLAALSPAGAAAAPGTRVGGLAVVAASEIVHFHDLDLGQRKDAAILYRRIRLAAERVCRSSIGTSIEYSCYVGAVGNAVRAVNQPLVTGYFRRETGRSPPA